VGIAHRYTNPSRSQHPDVVQPVANRRNPVERHAASHSAINAALSPPPSVVC
jgi:hypothetical protein